MTIILAGLFIASREVIDHGPRSSSVDAEIRLLAQACESYKTDHGEYPQDKTPGRGSVTNSLDASVHDNPADYVPACSFLYVALSGDTNANGVIDNGETATNYLPDFFKPSRLGKDANGRAYIRDPSGNCYGYSTAGLLLDQEYMASLAANTSEPQPKAHLRKPPWETNLATKNPVPKPTRNSAGTVGYNNTFDLWSTGGAKDASASDTAKWIKNW